MASLIIPNSVTPTVALANKSRAYFKYLHTLKSPAVSLAGNLSPRNTRGFTAVTRAGPTTTSYVAAFMLPFSLIALTVFTSIKVADDLDRKYLEELAINEAIMEAEGYEEGDDDDDDDDVGEGEELDSDANVSLKEPALLPEPATLPRARNRPKREA